MYDPEGQSTPAYPGDASDDSALSDLSDASDSDSDTPKSSTKGKGKGKAKAGFAGKGRRLADGEDIKPSRIRDAVDHIDYCKRYPDEDDEQYERRCFKKWTYDKGAEDREEFKKKERKLKKELGRKLTNGEKNEIRLVKVSKPVS